LRAAPQHVGHSIARVTYVDADCYFFSSPQRLLERFEATSAAVMVTPHNYSPEYDESEKAGRFCVQFLPFRDTDKAAEILEWWQERCVEWCYTHHEPGRFGDQKYLDEWPRLFGDAVFILDDPVLALAPWNVEELMGVARAEGNKTPCMYHFHGLKFIGPRKVQLYLYYRLSKRTIKRFYHPFLKELALSFEVLSQYGYRFEVARPHYSLGERYSRAIHTLRAELRTARIVR
jgi:hypothetical protein